MPMVHLAAAQDVKACVIRLFESKMKVSATSVPLALTGEFILDLLVYLFELNSVRPKGISPR
jgi:hypothetical protein